MSRHGILIAVIRWRPLVVALGCVGCHAAPAPTDTGGTTGTSPGTTIDLPPDGPPDVVDLGASATSLAMDERLTLTAFVQHPRGDEAVSGGVLLGPGAPAEYGAFVRGTNGRWSFEVGWDDVAAHQDLTFEGELVVEVTASFVDDVGMQAQRAIDLVLRCNVLAPNACAGTCVDFETSSDHCGSCGRSCAIQSIAGGRPLGGCAIGACAPIWSECFDPQAYADCAQACTSLGTTCAENQCVGRTVLQLDGDASCGSRIELSRLVDPDGCDVALSGAVARCCCLQGRG